VKGSDVIRAYHARRVAPLLARVLLMHRMVPVAWLEGMVLAEGPLADSKIAQRLKEVMDAPKDSTRATIDFVYPVLRHPSMHAGHSETCGSHPEWLGSVRPPWHARDPRQKVYLHKFRRARWNSHSQGRMARDRSPWGRARQRVWPQGRLSRDLLP
jgi:hypothetical protein